jgi:hypothetical protein
MKKYISLLFLAASVSFAADTYYLGADMDPTPARNSPLIKELWHVNADGTGDHPQQITSNFFVINGKAWRTPNTGGISRFPGGIVVDEAGAGTGELLSASWNPEMIKIQNKALFRLRLPEVTLFPEVVEIDKKGLLQFRAHNDGSDLLYLEIGKLQGTGELCFGAYRSTDLAAEWNLSVSDGSSFSGKISVNFGRLTIPSFLKLPEATLAVATGSVLKLDSVNLVIGQLIFEGKPLSPGEYKVSVDSENAKDSLLQGSGTVTVLR